MMYFIQNEDTVNKIHHKDQSAFVGYLYILDFLCSGLFFRKLIILSDFHPSLPVHTRFPSFFCTLISIPFICLPYCHSFPFLALYPSH
jgi:hypothetical protein